MLSANKPQFSFLFLALCLSAILISIYSVSIGHNFYFDEKNIILDNPNIRSLKLIPELFKNGYFYFEGRGEHLWDEYYRPLTSVTFALDFFFWQTNPLGYNITNLFLHIALCVLLFKLIETLLNHRLAAFLATLLYSVHTLHTEAVTYTASRGDILGTMLLLAVLLLYLRKQYFWSILCYILAVFSKENMILIVVYVLALDLAVVRSDFKALLKKISPYVAVAIGVVLFRRFICPVPLNPPSSTLQDMALRFLGMGDGFCKYIHALFLPEYFKAFSEVRPAKSFLDPIVFSTLGIMAAIMGAWALTLRKRGPALFGWTVFMLGFAPYSQIVHFYPEWAEHYAVIPAIGLAVLLGLLVKKIMSSDRAFWKRWFIFLYTPFLIFICVRTYQRNETYNVPDRYYQLLSQTDTPYRFFGYQSIAQEAMRKGQLTEALINIKIALMIQPDSDVSNEIAGQCYLRQGHYAQALEYFEKAYLLGAPNYHRLQKIGSVQLALGQYDDAIKTFMAMKDLLPHATTAYTHLMMAYEIKDDEKKVLGWSRAAFEAVGDSTLDQSVLYTAMARYEYRRGDDAKARQHLKMIIESLPSAWWYTDHARFMLGQVTPSEFSQRIVEKYPQFKKTAPPMILMSKILQGKKEEAFEYFKEAEPILLAAAKENPMTQREINRARRHLGIPS